MSVLVEASQPKDSPLPASFDWSQDFLTIYRSQIQSFHEHFWPPCDGFLLPFEVNPKRLVKLGFKCIADSKIECFHCAQSATLPPELTLDGILELKKDLAKLGSREADEKERQVKTNSCERFLARLKTSTHLFSCPFNASDSQNSSKQFKLQMSQSTAFNIKSAVNLTKFSVFSAKLLHLRAEEILTKLALSHARPATLPQVKLASSTLAQLNTLVNRKGKFPSELFSTLRQCLNLSTASN